MPIPARNRDREIGVRNQEAFDHLDDRLRRIGSVRIQHNKQLVRRRVHPLAERSNFPRACRGNEDRIARPRRVRRSREMPGKDDLY